MTVLSRRTSTRAIAALTSVAVAASTAVIAFAPSATAYVGPESAVKGAVLSTAEISSLLQWDSGTYPLRGTYTRYGAEDWGNVMTPAHYPTDQATPVRSELATESNPQYRDEDFTSFRAQLSDAASSVSVDTASVFTADLQMSATAKAPALLESISVRKAGPDGIVVSGCGGPVSTTTTSAGQRALCANIVGAAQARAWAKKSPTFVFKSSKTVAKKLFTGSQARKVVGTPKTIKIVVAGQIGETDVVGGRQFTRYYQVLAKKKYMRSTRFSAPQYASVIQYGNRLNATGVFTVVKAAKKKKYKLYNSTSTRFTITYRVLANGKPSHYAVTYIRYSDIVVLGACEANPDKKPSASALRLCSKRLATAELARLKPLFRNVK